MLSTLHFNILSQGRASKEECEFVRQSSLTFDVESEICSQVLSFHSRKVQLLEFNAEHDIGIFKLLDRYPPISDWIDVDWLLERDKIYELNPIAGSKVACVVYNGPVNEEDARSIRNEATRQTSDILVSFSKIL